MSEPAGARLDYDHNAGVRQPQSVSVNLTPDEIKHNLSLVLISVQDAVARRLRLLPPNPDGGRSGAWAAYKKDMELMQNLIKALESYS